MTPAILAVDGGQSAIRVRHSNGAAADVPGTSWAGRQTYETVAARIVEAWRAAGSPPVDVAVLGLTTAPPDGSADRFAELVAGRVGAERVVVCDDGVTTHAGALGGGWGVALAVGTGVACAALGPTGPATIVGGHGYLLGDEGGGYWLGRAGLSAALRAREGRGPDTALAAGASEAFGDLADAHVRIAADERAVDRIAHFAPVVLEAASAGDLVAARIVADGVGELVGVLHAAWRAAGSHARTPTVVTGRLASAMGDRLRSAIDETAGRFDFRPPAGDAIDGGLALAGLATRYGGLVRTWTREAS